MRFKSHGSGRPAFLSQGVFVWALRCRNRRGSPSASHPVMWKMSPALRAAYDSACQMQPLVYYSRSYLFLRLHGQIAPNYGLGLRLTCLGVAWLVSEFFPPLFFVCFDHVGPSCGSTAAPVVQLPKTAHTQDLCD